MAANVALDDKLSEEARKISRHRTKKETVTIVLKACVRHRKQRGILDRVDKAEYRDDHDDKKLRQGRRR